MFSQSRKSLGSFAILPRLRRCFLEVSGEGAESAVVAVVSGALSSRIAFIVKKNVLLSVTERYSALLSDTSGISGGRHSLEVGMCRTRRTCGTGGMGGSGKRLS